MVMRLKMDAERYIKKVQLNRQDMSCQKEKLSDAAQSTSATQKFVVKRQRYATSSIPKP